MTAGLSLMRSILTPLAKSVLLPVGLTTLVSAKESVVQKKISRSSMKALIISSEEMEYIMKFVKSLKKLRLLIEGVNKTIKNEAKEQKGRFLGMLIGTSAVSLLGRKT